MAQSTLVVEATRSRDIFRQASALYSSVFGYESADHSLNPKLLSAIVANGGAAVAAQTTTGDLVGFAYGFVGFDGSTPYLYSQAAFIDHTFQGQGVGRQLKQAQREIALAAGLSSMRWAFDPILARNAHFNLDVLGATGVKFAPRYYDEPFSDRLVVDWDLQAPPRKPAPLDRSSLPAITARDWGMPLTSGTSILIPIPLSSPEKTLSANELDSLRITIAETFTAVTSQKYAAVSCERFDEASAVYVFVPKEDL